MTAKVLNIILVALFLMGLVLAVVAPTPITIGCAIYNGAMVGIAFAIEYA